MVKIGVENYFAERNIPCPHKNNPMPQIISENIKAALSEKSLSGLIVFPKVQMTEVYLQVSGDTILVRSSMAECGSGMSEGAFFLL